MKPIETIEYKGFKINIYPDRDAPNPREWDNLGTMVCWHRRYILGDEQPECDPDEYDLPKNAIVLPLYLYDHSGITISTGSFSCKWDSGQIGFIYVTKEKLKAEGLGNETEDEIKERLKGEVETYDEFLTGAIYGREILDNEGNEIDTARGFFGYDHEKSGLLPDAKGTIDCIYNERKKKHFTQLKKWIKQKLPVMYRKPFSLVL